MTKRSRKAAAAHPKPKEPAGLPEFAARIALLGDALGFHRNQTAFAEYIRHGLAQGTLSSWVTGKCRPSAEMFLRLGSIAPDPEQAIWFFNEAGLTQASVVEAARAIGKRLKGHPPAGRSVGILPLTKGSGEQEIWFPAEFVRDADRTRYYKIPDDKALVYSPGDIVLVERPQPPALALQPYWGKIVLVGMRGQPSESYMLGRLRMDFSPERTRDIVWYGVLTSDGRLGAATHIVGEWRREAIPTDPESRAALVKRFRHDPMAYTRMGSEYYDACRQEMKIAEMMEIIGHVIAWSEAPEEESAGVLDWRVWRHIGLGEPWE